jgi:hypothetical protein
MTKNFQSQMQKGENLYLGVVISDYENLNYEKTTHTYLFTFYCT